MMVQDFHKQLEEKSGMRLKLKINNNRSTMISVREGSVSIHRMFLNAPNHVQEALASYIRGDHKTVAPLVKSYINENLRKQSSPSNVNRRSLVAQGRVYDLQILYDEVNSRYFNNQLNLSITWFGNPKKQGRSRIVFGLYYESLKLIKIHCRLDGPEIPKYIVTYTIYHEMLHAACPGYVDENGVRRVHGREFKQLEKQFLEYPQARDWIKKYQKGS